MKRFMIAIRTDFVFKLQARLDASGAAPPHGAAAVYARI
jgi:hypothetical protein